ncbi:ABC-type phosphate/phosphonate transport system, substrate-binding protein [Dethiosulfatibacter aminovorans DSM 17477]|uniref:ABC-type phosphate/phosphonate transport system, substrate-binding protein n=1 Tax=Dethiosulfatibacter aminovorans DSM 17477 TaxID=1121476 RepID=A0A1M6AZ18_9FIRM|nr:PhnD/SsuA/transferrin family substrate-binding protein [Dethiosulfatibacter aminovorans]SHI41725.1 ABC-type phosphate/phosphonate transport system, substrate-binding protein [Dethiosulfatibacter aminovorans DSM 17477]
MKKIIIMIMICVLALASFTGCQKKEGKVYTMAVLPQESGTVEAGIVAVNEEMNKALEPFNASVEMILVDDYSVVSESVLTGTAEFAAYSAATYLKAHAENDKILPLFVHTPEGDTGKGGYWAYIAVHVDEKDEFEGLGAEEALLKLRDKSFSFVSSTSTSGRLVPTTTLWNAIGPDGKGIVDSKKQIFEENSDNGGYFSEIIFAGTHPASVEMILNKKAYAGAYCCDYGDERADELYVIAESLVPCDPYWMNTENIEQEHIDAIIAHFENITPENAVEGLYDDDTTDYSVLHSEDRFVAVDHELYSFLEKMYEGE